MLVASWVPYWYLFRDFYLSWVAKSMLIAGYCTFVYNLLHVWMKVSYCTFWTIPMSMPIYDIKERKVTPPTSRAWYTELFNGVKTMNKLISGKYYNRAYLSSFSFKKTFVCKSKSMEAKNGFWNEKVAKILFWDEKDDKWEGNSSRYIYVVVK